jgi:hypothetical protein
VLLTPSYVTSAEAKVALDIAQLYGKHIIVGYVETVAEHLIPPSLLGRPWIDVRPENEAFWAPRDRHRRSSSHTADHLPKAMITRFAELLGDNFDQQRLHTHVCTTGVNHISCFHSHH